MSSILTIIRIRKGPPGKRRHCFAGSSARPERARATQLRQTGKNRSDLLLPAAASLAKRRRLSVHPALLAVFLCGVCSLNCSQWKTHQPGIKKRENRYVVLRDKHPFAGNKYLPVAQGRPRFSPGDSSLQYETALVVMAFDRLFSHLRREMTL